MKSRIGLAGLLLTACGGGIGVTIDCQSEPDMEVVCGFQNPEDLALLPGGTLVVSQGGATPDSPPGSLVFFKPGSDGPVPLFPRTSVDPPDAAAGVEWGESGCPGPPDARFSPHGIDVAQRPDGTWMLLAINHGGRESVEFFEVGISADTPSLAWRGCAIPPEGSNFNDLVILPDGGFLVTHMFPKGGVFSTSWNLLRATLFGSDIGYILEWQPEAGFSVVPGTESPFPNGIEISPDGSILYLNVYLGGEHRAVARATGERIFTVEIEMPDNVTWGSDGRLLIASKPETFSESMACSRLEAGSCALPFEIIAVDPKTGDREVVLSSDGTPMGAGTVGLQVGTDLWIGSWAGDRLARVSLED